MKKIICLVCVALVLVFSCCAPAFADNSVLTVENLSDTRWIVSGNSTIKDGFVTVPAGGYYSAFIRVKPISATRKYKFNAYYGCTCSLGSSFSLQGSIDFYYVDTQTQQKYTIKSYSKITNAGGALSNTITIADDSGDSGRIYFVVTNNSSTPFTVCLETLTVNDMTTVELDSSLDKFGDKIENSGSDSPPLDTDISAFQSAIDTMNEWLEQLDTFADSIESAGDTASEYITKGTEIFNGFLGVAPASVIALVGFGIVFIVVRKIVGR